MAKNLIGDYFVRDATNRGVSAPVSFRFCDLT
jgi:hypothetical protein